MAISHAIIIGEIAFNLRSALDHLVWQLVRANGECPSNQNQFPIFDDENTYREEVKRRLKGIGPYHQSVIETLQPFGPNRVGKDLLMLNHICQH